MATLTKNHLSNSTYGKAIKIVLTGSTGTSIHTSIASTTGDFDEIWLFAVNSSTSAVKLTIQWGETTDPDGMIEQTIQGESGLVLVIPGLVLQGSCVVYAFAGTANVIMIHGYVNEYRI